MNTRLKIHRSSLNRRCAWLAACVCTIAMPVAAQVDYRVDYRQSANGRMYDANTRVGSGGVNPRAQNSYPYAFNYDIYANQIVTGNVTGLAGFKGLSVIPGVNQFRGGLQSDALAQFRARSVNIEQVRSGTALGAGSYFDPSNQIANLGAIRLGLNQPGSSFLSSPQVQLPTNSGLSVRDRLLGIDQSIANRGYSAQDEAPFDVGRTYQRPIVADARNRVEFSDSLPTDPYRAAMQSTLFGSPQFNQEPLPLLNPDTSKNDRPLDGRFSTALSREELLGIVDTPDESGLDPAGIKVDSAGDPGAGLATRFDPLVNGIGRSDRVVIPFETGTDDSKDELYSRMIEAVQQLKPDNPLDGFMARRNAQESGEASLTPSSGYDASQPVDSTRATMADSSAAERQSDPRQTNGVSESEDNREMPELIESDPLTQWASLFVDTPIRSFSMGGSAPIGEYMRSAEAALRKGEFNRASRLFDLAATIEPDNPLPLLGRGHANIAAGQYYSAALSIQAGLRLFPQIAAFELDLPTLTGQTDTFDRRRADLESILARKEQYELRFLLGYIELYSGLQFDGLNDLQKAAKNAPAGSVVADFPDRLLGRKRINAPLSPR